MFGICFNTTNTNSSIAIINDVKSISNPVIKSFSKKNWIVIKITEIVAADRDPKAAILVVFTTPKKVITPIGMVIGEYAKSAPAPDATALPPLSLRKIE